MKEYAVKTRKKLIEVALPLDAINEEGSRRKRKAPGGFPTTLHKWWAQRPIAAARAVIFAQMVDDPSSSPDLFPTEQARERERMRLFAIIEDLVKWENTTSEAVLKRAREEIWRSWRRTCADNADHPRAEELFDRHSLPPFHDPFGGSGAIPLEAQRLGLQTFSSDLNPVAVLINKAMIEVPYRFAGQPPVNPAWRGKSQEEQAAHIWTRAHGLAEDVRYYGRWMRDEAERRIGHLYPPVEVTADMARARPDLRPYVGRKLPAIAWLWARTVKSPNPAFANVDVPLVSSFMLSTKPGREAYVEPVVDGQSYRFVVKLLPQVPADLDGEERKQAESARREKIKELSGGTKLGRGSNFRCLMSGSPIAGDYIKAEGMAGRIGVRLMAIVVDGARGRIHVSPCVNDEEAARRAHPTWRPEGDLPARLTGGTCVPYGLSTWASLFSDRQLVTLGTLASLLSEVRSHVEREASVSNVTGSADRLRDGGRGPGAYAEAVTVYLAFALSRAADYGSTLATWRPKDNAMRSTLPKQALQMTWDFAEGSPLASSSSGFSDCAQVVAGVIEAALGGGAGSALQASASEVSLAAGRAAVVSTDPPYYANVGYADLSDFFYVWLRRVLRHTYPELFDTLAVPKAEELVAAPYRHGGVAAAKAFFLDGMTAAIRRVASQAHPAFPITIYYALKQAETETDEGTASTGWETFLEAVSRAGLAISGTWPMRTEGDNRQVGIGANALSSSIVLVCRAKSSDARTCTRREFVAALEQELPEALRLLHAGSIAPVDLAQAAIGPGMAVFTRYSKVVDAVGDTVSVREALALINQTLDEALAQHEGDFDADSRWALTWFEQSGFDEGEYGDAELLSKSKNTSVAGMVESGIVESKRGKVRLLRPEELPADWDPATDPRLTAWEVAHHLIRVLARGGEAAAAGLLAKLGAKAEVARELAYRLYTLCERKKRAADALAYNGLVQSWPEIARLASAPGMTRERDQRLPGME